MKPWKVMRAFEQGEKIECKDLDGLWHRLENPHWDWATHDYRLLNEQPKFKLSKRSLDNLVGVQPELVAVVKRAIEITTVDFGVTEGLRTTERQKHLVNVGASQAWDSRHLTGHAVDLVAYDGSEISWAWPLYEHLATAMKYAAIEHSVKVEWGGDWLTFKDGPHFQIPR